MRRLLLPLVAALSLTCCTFSLLPPSTVSDKPVEVPSVEKSAPKGYDIQFAPPVEAPEQGRLWVCGAVEAEFFCVDFDLYMQSLLQNTRGSRTTL